jgi:hypothetical protein
VLQIKHIPMDLSTNSKPDSWQRDFLESRDWCTMRSLSQWYISIPWTFAYPLLLRIYWSASTWLSNQASYIASLKRQSTWASLRVFGIAVKLHNGRGIYIDWQSHLESGTIILRHTHLVTNLTHPTLTLDCFGIRAISFTVSTMSMIWYYINLLYT